VPNLALIALGDSHHSQGGMKFATQISPLLNLKKSGRSKSRHHIFTGIFYLYLTTWTKHWQIPLDKITKQGKYFLKFNIYYVNSWNRSLVILRATANGAMGLFSLYSLKYHTIKIMQWMVQQLKTWKRFFQKASWSQKIK
jgi:hypothetical protein